MGEVGRRGEGGGVGWRRSGGEEVDWEGAVLIEKLLVVMRRWEEMEESCVPMVEYWGEKETVTVGLWPV